MAEALLAMSRKGSGVTDGDLRRPVEGILDRQAFEVMAPAPRAIALAKKAVTVTPARPITCLLVTDDADGADIDALRVAGITHDGPRAGLG